jgi:hypothetical protein
MGRLRFHRTVLTAVLVCALAAHGCAADAADKDEPCRAFSYISDSGSAYARELAAGRVGPPGLPFAQSSHTPMR